MQDETIATTPAPPTRPGARTALKVGLVAAGIVAGAIGATAFGASATTSGTGSASASAYSATANGSASTAPSAAPADGRGPGGPGGPGGQNPNETLVTDAALKAKLTTAAQQAVPGATVDKVETDSGDAKYEVHLTKSDGSRVTVKFDANGNKTAVEDGMGK